MKKKIKLRDFNVARREIVNAFKIFTERTEMIPDEYKNNPDLYREIQVRIAIVREIAKLERLVFEYEYRKTGDS